MSQTTITDIGTMGIPVSDQDKAVEFFAGTPGFDKRHDMRTVPGAGPAQRMTTDPRPGK